MSRSTIDKPFDRRKPTYMSYRAMQDERRRKRAWFTRIVLAMDIVLVVVVLARLMGGM